MKRLIIILALLLLAGNVYAQFGHGKVLKAFKITNDTTVISKETGRGYFYTGDSLFYVAFNGLLKQVGVEGDTIAFAKVKLDTLEGWSTDSIFVNDDFVLLKNFLFKGISSNSAYYVNASGDTIIWIDPNAREIVNIDSTFSDTLTSNMAYLVTINNDSLDSREVTITDSTFADTLTSNMAYLVTIHNDSLDSREVTITDSTFADTLTSNMSYLTTIHNDSLDSREVTITDSIFADTLTSNMSYLTTIHNDSLDSREVTITDSTFADTLTSNMSFLTTIHNDSLDSREMTITDSTFADTLTSNMAYLVTIHNDSLDSREVTITDSLFADTLKTNMAYLTTISADSLNLRELTVTDSAYIDTLTSAVSRVTGKLFVEDSFRVEETVLIKGATTINNKLIVQDSLRIGGPTTDNKVPIRRMGGDADSDVGQTTRDSWTQTLTAEATPTNAVWDNTSTQSKGYRFDKVIGVGSGSIPTTLFGCGLDLSYGGVNTLMLGADNNLYTRSNNTMKVFRITGYPYANANTALCAMQGRDGFPTSSTGHLTIGGGTSVLNCYSTIAFYTAANNTTVTGTQAMTINSSQQVMVGSGTPLNKFEVWGDKSADTISCIRNDRIGAPYDSAYGMLANGQIFSAVPTGTSPFLIASTTINTNLNADMVDGTHIADIQLVADFGDSLLNYDGAGLEVVNNDAINVLVDYDGGLEISDDSLNIKLNGATLTLGSSGLSVTNDPADRLLKVDFGDSLVNYDGAGLEVVNNDAINILVDYDGGLEISDDSLNIKLNGATLTLGSSGISVTNDPADRLLKVDFGDSLVNYDGYGVTITDNDQIEVDTTAIATVYDNGLKLDMTAFDDSLAANISTSADIAGLLSDETGSGLLVFGTAPTFTDSITVGKIRYGSSPITIDVTGSGNSYVEIIQDNYAGYLAVGRTSATEPSCVSITDGGSDNEPGFLSLYDDEGTGHWLWMSSGNALRGATSQPADDDLGGYQIMDFDDGTIGTTSQPVQASVATMNQAVIVDSIQVGSGLWIRKYFMSTSGDSVGCIYYNTILARIDTAYMEQ